MCKFENAQCENDPLSKKQKVKNKKTELVL